MSLICGLDPGAVSGAYAVLDSTGALLAVDDLPTIADGKTRWIDAPTLLASLMEIKAGRDMRAIVERQGGRPGQGISSTFVSATAYGSLLATLQLAGCAIEFYTAASWKCAVGLSYDKQESLDRARLRYPRASLHRKRDHGKAEAILLAEYALSRRPT